jgi:hypothetical protein
MAGTIVIDTIKTSNTSPPVFQNTGGTEVGQLCRAWVNFNGVTTATIRASFNVSSVTRNGTGDYTINFTNAMTDANYSLSGSSSLDISTAQVFQNQFTSFPPTTTSARIRSARADTGAAGDASYICVAVFR